MNVCICIVHVLITVDYLCVLRVHELVIFVAGGRLKINILTCGHRQINHGGRFNPCNPSKIVIAMITLL